MEKRITLIELQKIPGVGVTIANDSYNLGIRKVSDLKGRNPEELYNELCVYQNSKVDICMLYVFKCAVYFASNTQHDPEKLKWWNWKEAKGN